MDAPLILQLSALVATAAGSSFATKFVERQMDARRKRASGEPLPALAWQDALAQANDRITALVNNMNQRTADALARIENTIVAHHTVAFPALERQVSRLDLAMKDHTREHEELEDRMVRVEKRMRYGTKDCPLAGSGDCPLGKAAA